MMTENGKEICKRGYWGRLDAAFKNLEDPAGCASYFPFATSEDTPLDDVADAVDGMP